MAHSSDPSALRTLARLRAHELQGSIRLDLRRAGLEEFPAEILTLADTLEVLDLSDNALVDLPDALAGLKRLHTVFVSGNRLDAVPRVLGRLPALDTLGLKANRIERVAAEALAPTLRWLILTDNRIAELPARLTECERLQKLMLAGNRLRALPEGMGRLRRLELIRLSANCFERIEHALPDALLELPELAWLAHAGNPFSAVLEQGSETEALERVPWQSLRMGALLGEGASGRIYAASWSRGRDGFVEVAIKLFKGGVTSDGLPRSEMTAALQSGHHPHLLGALGRLVGHPDGVEGLVLPKLGPAWKPLASPPSMLSCSRDVYADGIEWPFEDADAIYRAARSALSHLHGRGLSHGDLYGHNLLVDGRGGTLLSDFGAASFLPRHDATRSEALRKLDLRALEILRQELARRSAAPRDDRADGRSP